MRRERRSRRALVGQAFLLSGLALGAGCGENVLVGNWQLRSLDDAGLASAHEMSADVDADAGTNPQARAADDARDHEQKKGKKSH